MKTVTLSDGGTITVSFEGNDYSPFDGDTRPAYMATIRAESWEYQDDTLRGPVNGEPDEQDMISTLASFLSACAEAQGYPSSITRNLFPEHVAQWAASVSDELCLLGADE